jgi:hypothetical protein
MMLTLLVTFYVSMVSAGYLVELLFGAAGLIPTQRNATVMHASISWNYDNHHERDDVGAGAPEYGHEQPHNHGHHHHHYAAEQRANRDASDQ